MNKTNKYYFIFSVLMAFLVCSNTMMPQENKRLDTHFFIEGGLNFGGKISANNFSYKSGQNFQFGFLKSVNKKTDIGLGIGFERLNNDYFYPISFRVESKIFKNPNFKLLLQTGYAFGRTVSDVELLNVDLEGGFFMETGRAWSIVLNEKIRLLSSVTFKYQFAEKEFISLDSKFEEDEDFLMLMFKLGVFLK